MQRIADTAALVCSPADTSATAQDDTLADQLDVPVQAHHRKYAAGHADES